MVTRRNYTQEKRKLTNAFQSLRRFHRLCKRLEKWDCCVRIKFLESMVQKLLQRVPAWPPAQPRYTSALVALDHCPNSPRIIARTR
ncbi:MAG: hypothetical protein LDLANPLL_01733 [Turneriella sp.]|nr:hypothetical protein [Turneriella sp.]